jgi:hypothetical protein
MIDWDSNILPYRRSAVVIWKPPLGLPHFEENCGSMRVNRRFSMSIQSWTLGHLAGGIRITAYSQKARHCLQWWLTIRVSSFALSKDRVIDQTSIVSATLS